MTPVNDAGSDCVGHRDAAWWQPYLNVVLYPVQFTTDPSAHVDHGLQVFLSSRADQAAEFVTAIEAALSSGASLLLVGQLGPVPHSQDQVRAYLAGMAHGIQARLSCDHISAVPADELP